MTPPLGSQMILLTIESAYNLFFKTRFEGVGEQTHLKLDPTLKKSLSRNELGIIVLFAAANGDLLTLKRFDLC